MFWVALVAAALGALVFFAVKQHLHVRDRREQESLGVQALYEEMDAALRSVNMAAREADSRWVTGLSESPTLAETWLANGRAFERLDMAQWEILDEAVKAVEPSYGLGLVRPGTELHPSLAERQERLRRGIDVLRDMLPLEVKSGVKTGARRRPSRVRRRPS